MKSRDALNPDLARVLRMFNLDRLWDRGEGVWLYDQNGRRFLDCYSQYGAVALGHNAPSVVTAACKELERQSPAMVQPYRARHAVTLAQELVRVAPKGLRYCVFTSSGAETVETAIKLVRARTRRCYIVSCEGAYHGMTLGAMAASGDSTIAEFYGPPLPGFARVPFGDLDALESFLTRNRSDVAAVFLEPIQGERGVYLPSKGYLLGVRELCDRFGVAMVVDEIQTGLGRTGRLFACEEDGVSPDLLLLSKALGGGLFPLGACLASEEFWDQRFALSHSSTFANNNIACRAGLAVLDVITQPGFCDSVREKGKLLLAGLHDLAQRHPHSVAEVRGRGLLTAIELRAPAPMAGVLFSYLFHQNLYAYAFASTLAERDSILVLPTLGNSNVIRITPPLVIKEAQIRQALKGLDDVLTLFEQGKSSEVAKVIGKLDSPPSEDLEQGSVSAGLTMLPPQKSSPDGEASFAFLVHCTTREDIITTDPDLARLSGEEFDRYCRYLSDLPPGVVCEVPTIRSRQGTGAKGWLIGIGLLPEEMAARGRPYVAGEISRAVDLATTLGAKVVGLGAYTKIYSRHGEDVVGRGPIITTGNALTADMAIRAVKRVQERRGKSLVDATVGVVGAMGSVGQICAKLLARERLRSLMLIGRPGSSNRALGEFGNSLAALGRYPVRITTDLSMLSRCNVLLSATSARQPVLDDVLFERGTIICDVAQPADTGERLKSRPDITVIKGGLVSLPDNSVYLGAGNLQGYPPGVQLACFAETVLLTMANFAEDVCIGKDIDLGQVDRIRALADRHGFDLAEPSSDSLDRYLFDAPATGGVARKWASQ